MRYYLSRKKVRKNTSQVKKLIKWEKKIGLNRYSKLKNFRNDCIKSKKRI